MQRLAQHGQLDEAGLERLRGLGLLPQGVEELLKVSEEVPEGTPLVEVEVHVGDDEPNVVDEALLDELLKEKEEAVTEAVEEAVTEVESEIDVVVEEPVEETVAEEKELSYSEKRAQAIAEKVAKKQQDD